jgi:hypothetical protein
VRLCALRSQCLEGSDECGWLPRLAQEYRTTATHCAGNWSAYSREHGVGQIGVAAVCAGKCTVAGFTQSRPPAVSSTSAPRALPILPVTRRTLREVCWGSSSIRVKITLALAFVRNVGSRLRPSRMMVPSGMVCWDTRGGSRFDALTYDCYPQVA